MSIEKLIGQRIGYIRKHAGITQETLAEKAGISRDFLSRVERGITGISLQNLECISKSLNVPIRELFAFEEKINNEQLVENITILLRNQDRDVLKKWYEALQILLG
jgi:transcriptional regulator with XRE-family HTH domain